MSLLLKLSLVIYAVLVTIYCFQKKFRSQRWLRIFSKMLCSVGFLLVAAACGLESGFRKEPLWSWGIFAALAFSALGDLFLVLQKGEAGRKKFDPFTLGGISFFSAHVLFSAVFVYYRGFHWGTVIAALGLAGIQLGMLARVKRRLDMVQHFFTDLSGSPRLYGRQRLLVFYRHYSGSFFALFSLRRRWRGFISHFRPAFML